MLTEMGGLAAAKRLINEPEISEWFAILMQKGKLELGVEALVVENPEYYTLFTSEEIVRARERLIAVGYNPKEMCK